MAQNREIETKYVIPSEAELARFTANARSHSFPRLQAKHFSGPFARGDTYFDTEDLILLLTGKCFRMGGKSSTHARITFKESTADPRERIEITDVLKMANALAALDIAVPSRAVDALQKRIGYKAVLPKLRVYKMFYTVIINDCEVAFGHVVYSGEYGAIERLDLEIEAKGTATVKEVKKVGSILAPEYGLILDMRSKYETGMALVGGKAR